MVRRHSDVIRITMLVLAVVSMAFAQPNGILTGTVTDSATRLPLLHALVSSSAARDVTGADGSFRLPDLPPGDLQIHVSAMGYRTLDQTVHLSDGEHASTLFEVHPMARVTGRILDKETGEGVVRDLQLAPIAASGAGLFVYPATSAKDGTFRFESMEPGEYRLLASSSMGDAALATDISEKPKSKTVYGNYVNPETIHLAEGEQKLVEIHVAQTEAHSASVSVEYPRGCDNLPSQISYGASYGDGVVFTRVLGTQAAGPFRIDGLVPGRYRIYLQAGKGAMTAYGNVLVAITDHDVDELVIKLQPGVSVSGSIRILEDGASLPVKTPNLAAVVTPTDGWLAVAGQVMNIVDYQFHGESLPQGQFEADIAGLPDGYAVSSVLFDGADTLGRPIPLYGAGELTFVVTSKAANITGVVRDANQNPVKGATVPLRHDPPLPNEPFEQIITGATGEFKFRNLAPGHYSIEGAKPIELKPGETATVAVVR